MRSPLRIAVLECDEPAGETKKKYGCFGNVFKELLEAGASRIAERGSRKRPELDISGYDVVKAQVYPDVESVDAVLLSGSRYDAFGPGENDWISTLVDFVRKILHEQTRVRVMGVCFGHQIIGRALGVMPKRSDRGWEVAVTAVQLTEKGKQLFGLESLVIHEMHRDIIPTYPPHIEPLGHSSRCDVQGLYSKDRLISVQGHPEFNGEIVNELLELRRGTVLNDETYQDGKDRADDPHDGVAIAAGFVKFLSEN